jgi:acetolactate synthase small subunit
VELTGLNDQMDAFIARLGACSEIVAVVRSGAMAIARGHNVLGSGF